MTALRYRLGFTEPLFSVPPPDPARLRGLTTSELDELAHDLRQVEGALRDYDEIIGNRLGAIKRLEDPWWAELRPEMLRRGFNAESLDECVGSCASTEFYFRNIAEPGWLRPLLLDVIGRVDPVSLAGEIREHTVALARLNVGKLVARLQMVAVFHPFGTPHQLQISNFAALWGMQPIVRTDDGSVVYGYQDKTPKPDQLPWLRGEVIPEMGVRPADGDPELFWPAAYEGLLSWIGEVCIVVGDRLQPIADAVETLEHLAFEVEFLAGIKDAAAVPQYAGLQALEEALSICRRVLLGLFEELHRVRELLVENLRSVLFLLDASWREPRPEGTELLKYDLRTVRGLGADSVDQRLIVKQVIAAIEEHATAFRERTDRFQAEALALIDQLKHEIGPQTMNLPLRLQIEKLEQMVRLTFVADGTP